MERVTAALKNLDLTDEQKAKAQQILSDARNKAQEIRGQAQGQGEQARQKFRELMEETRQKLSDVLTPEQRDKLREEMQQQQQQQQQGPASQPAGDAPRRERPAPKDKPKDNGNQVEKKPPAGGLPSRSAGRSGTGFRSDEAGRTTRSAFFV
jgi:vacuolar-type H+-ATPase subunit H